MIEINQHHVRVTFFVLEGLVGSLAQQEGAQGGVAVLSAEHEWGPEGGDEEDHRRPRKQTRKLIQSARDEVVFLNTYKLKSDCDY